MYTKQNVQENKLIKLLSLQATKDLLGIFAFTLLTAIAAQVSIPTKPVPFTFQTMIVLLSGAFLGARNGLYSQVLYLALGTIGLPVFAPSTDLSIGIMQLFGPTGGYLLAFPLAAFLTGLLIKNTKNYALVFITFLLGEILIIASGTLFLNTFYLHNLSESIALGAALFSLWTLAKILAGTSIYIGIKKFRKQK